MNITVSTNAIEQLANRYSDKSKVFRVMINGFGWGGPVFGIVLDEQFEGDHIEEKEGIKFAVNEDILDQFGSFKIDYTSNYFRKGFTISTDRGTSSC